MTATPAPSIPALSAPSTGKSTIIQRVLIKVNGDVFTQKEWKARPLT